MIDSATSAVLIAKEMGNFWATTLLHLYHMGNKVKLQQFALTMFLDSRGLSDNGRDVLSKLDICLSHGGFLSYRDECLNGAEDDIRYIPKSANLHMIYIYIPMRFLLFVYVPECHCGACVSCVCMYRKYINSSEILMNLKTL